jgi:hypothetical protein
MFMEYFKIQTWHLQLQDVPAEVPKINLKHMSVKQMSTDKK